MASSTRFLSSLLGNGTHHTETAAVVSTLDELDESDVVWSTTTADLTADTIAAENTSSAAIFDPDLKSAAVFSPPISNSSTSSISSTASINHHHHFHPPPPLLTGLSAALSSSLDVNNNNDNNHRHNTQLIQRKKTAINPTLSPAGAAAVSTKSQPYYSPSSSTSNTLSRSAPVKVPIWRTRRGVGGRHQQVSMMMMGRFDEDQENGDDDEDFDDGLTEEMVPPHEMVARSQRTTTFSVFEGVGRTLKGRDLTRVRNAVMQKTGFLE